MTWLRGNKGTSPVLELLWLEKITAHSRDRRETPPSDHSGPVLKGGAQPSFQATSKNRRTQTGRFTLKRRETSLKTTHSQFFFRDFSLSLTLLLFLFSLTTSLSSLSQPVHGERRASLAVTVGSPGSGNPPGLMHFLAQHTATWQLQATRGTPFRLTN